MKFLEKYFSSFLFYQNYGDCSLCEFPIEVQLPRKKQEQPKELKEVKKEKRFLKRVSSFLLIAISMGYMLVASIIGEL